MDTALRIWAAILGASLIIGETIRSYGQGRPLAFVVDDYLIGGFLIIAAWLYGRDTPTLRATFAASWAAAAGMLYGSFFAKVFPDPASSMHSNIPDDTLMYLVGTAFVSAVFGMIATILLPHRR